MAATKHNIVIQKVKNRPTRLVLLLKCSINIQLATLDMLSHTMQYNNLLMLLLSNVTLTLTAFGQNSQHISLGQTNTEPVNTSSRLKHTVALIILQKGDSTESQICITITLELISYDASKNLSYSSLTKLADVTLNML